MSALTSISPCCSRSLRAIVSSFLTTITSSCSAGSGSSYSTIQYLLMIFHYQVVELQQVLVWEEKEEKDSAQTARSAAIKFIPLCGALSQWWLNPVKLAHDPPSSTLSQLSSITPCMFHFRVKTYHFSVPQVSSTPTPATPQTIVAYKPPRSVKSLSAIIPAWSSLTHRMTPCHWYWPGPVYNVVHDPSSSNWVALASLSLIGHQAAVVKHHSCLLVLF